MTRKAQGKFRMPGIKGRGFKMTASAPFKLRSSLKQDEEANDAAELEFASTLGPEDDAYLESIQGSSKQEGQTGTNYFFEQLSKLAARNKQNKGKSDKLKEKEDEYEDFEGSENEKDPYRDKNKYPENFDKHGNYKGDLPEIYPDFNPGADEEGEGTETEGAETEGEVVEEGTSYYTPSEKTSTEETTTSEPKASYEGTTKSEMYDLRRPFREDGTWDPNNNPEHAAIQNRINELHDKPKRYDAGPVDNTELLSEMIEDGGRIYPHDSKWNALNPEEKQKYVDAINEELGPNAQYESVEDYQNWRDQS